MNYVNKKLESLTKNLFDIDCNRENLMFKLEQLTDSIHDLKDRILFLTNYPTELEVYEFPPYVIRIQHGNVEIFTADQYEKTEVYIKDEKF